MAQLATTERYTKDYPLRLDPATHSDGRFWYGVDSAGLWRRLPRNAVFDAIIETFDGTLAQPMEPVIEAFCAISKTPDQTRDLLSRAVELLLGSGLLRSALEFPAAPKCSWHALDDVASQLRPLDAAAWSEAVGSCRDVAGALEQGFDHFDPRDMRVKIAECRDAVSRMLIALDIDADVPDNPLRVDRSAPFNVSWSLAAQNSLHRAIAAVLEICAHAGAAEIVRRSLLAHRAGTRIPLGEAIRAAGKHQASAFAQGIAAWRSWMTQSRISEGGEIEVLPLLPLHSQVVPGFRGTMTFWVNNHQPPVYRWSRPQPDMAWSRFDPSFASGSGQPRLRFASAEVVGIDPDNPNAAVRFMDGHHQLGRHREATSTLSQLFLYVDADCRGWLEHKNGSSSLLPVYSSAARIGRLDPVSRYLFQLAMTHGWEFLAYQLELGNWLNSRTCSQITSEKAVMLSPRRWLISSSYVTNLRRLSGAKRFAAWRDLVTSVGVSALVFVARATPPDDPAFLIRTDSPLIVDCILNYFEDVDLIATEAPRAETWPLVDRNGNHYVSELAVGWAHVDYPTSRASGT